MGTRRRLVVSTIIALILLTAATPAAFAALQLDDGSHIVQRGETLASIARRHGVSQQALIEANDISNPSLIRVGQRLVIPDGSGATAPIPAGSIHVVAPGETLSSIAARYGVSVAALAQVNGIANPSRIRSGQRLVIPGSSVTPVQTGADETTGSVYVVQPGDTLTVIARRYGTSVGSIATANNVTNPSRIQTGQRLIIPEHRTPEIRPQAGLSVLVSISQQRCRVYQGEQILYDWPCSTGRSGAGTRTGTFYVQSKIREAWGSAFGFYMPYWLGIYWAGSTENGIHGLPYAPGGQPIWANAVGTAVTFGCVMLGAEESRTLWEMAYIGMPVTIVP